MECGTIDEINWGGIELSDTDSEPFDQEWVHISFAGV